MYRTINKEDISLINDWLEGWNMHRLEESMYPPTGLMMHDESTGEPIYAGFVWETKSSIYPIGFITRNPFYKNKNKDKQNTKTFIEQLLLYARDLGCVYATTWAENETLVKCFRDDFGFTEASNRTSELIAKIG